MSDLPELYIAADVESDGSIPGPYSMLPPGRSVTGHPDPAFHTELRPISDDFDPVAQARWRAVNAPHLVALVRAGSWFERGVLVERRQRAVA